MSHPCSRHQRLGLSLLEVLVALAIFLFSMVAIGRLVSYGGDRALDVKEQARATQLCQAKLDEVVAGVIPLGPESGAPFDEDPNWQWSLDAQNRDDIPGLWNVTVHVSRKRPDGSKIESSLSRMMLDPSLRGSSGNQAQPSTSRNATPSGSSSSSGGAGAGSPSGTGAGVPAATSKPTSGGMTAPSSSVLGPSAGGATSGGVSSGRSPSSGSGAASTPTGGRGASSTPPKGRN